MLFLSGIGIALATFGLLYYNTDYQHDQSDMDFGVVVGSHTGLDKAKLLVPKEPLHVVEEIGRESAVLSLEIPGALNGRRWVLMLTNTPLAASPVIKPGNVTRSDCSHGVRCVAFSGVGGQEDGSQSNLEYGFNEQSRCAHDAGKASSDTAVTGSSQFVNLYFHGQREYQSLNWARDSVQIPRFQPVPNVLLDFRFSDTRYNPNYHVRYVTANASFCQFVDLSGEQNIVAIRPDANIVDGGQVFWNRDVDNSIAHTVLTESRSAQFFANSALIISGFLISFATMVLPSLKFDFRLTLRRMRRRVRNLFL